MVKLKPCSLYLVMLGVGLVESGGGCLVGVRLNRESLAGREDLEQPGELASSRLDDFQQLSTVVQESRPR